MSAKTLAAAKGSTVYHYVRERTFTAGSYRTFCGRKITDAWVWNPEDYDQGCERCAAAADSANNGRGGYGATGAWFR